MKYLSLFSGIGGFELAIGKVFKNAECVGFSEIDERAISVYKRHFPDHDNFGDITKIEIEDLSNFDLLVGGSPCQDLSIAKENRMGLNGSRSGLFYKFVEILEKKKPKYFLLENVASMPKDSKNKISEILGVEPVMIDARLVSAQSRKRLFWCNWAVGQPEDQNICLKDIVEDDIIDKMVFGVAKRRKDRKKGMSKVLEIRGDKKANALTRSQTDSMKLIIGNQYNNRIFTEKIGTLGTCMGRTAKQGIGVYMNEISPENFVRKLTAVECERLQCFSDGYTELGEFGEKMADTYRYKMLGNAVNVSVVEFIIKKLYYNGIR